MVPRWLQDRPKRAPGEVLGPSWGGLGPLLGALGPSLEGLGGLLSRPEGVLGSLGTILGRFGMRLVDSIHRFDLRCDSSIPFVYWIEVCFCIMSSTHLDSTTWPGGMREAIK